MSRPGITEWKTKIVCTLGPASYSKEVIEGMVRAGMDVVRLNFSHGKHEEMRKIFQTVREISSCHHNQISIICDIQGPKIRTGVVSEAFNVAIGDKISVTPQEVVGNKQLITINYPNLLTDLEVGDLIFINDGIIRLVIESKEKTKLNCVVETPGMVSNHKGCNIPSGKISVDVLTEKDRKDLKLIAELDPEYVAASFIGNANDVHKIQNSLKEFGNDKIKIIAKIERPVALQNIDEILEAAWGIMVARGDLGVEIPAQLVPAAQKEMVRKANTMGRPVIVATQMLESMTTAGRPTRAEANDVFNAVLDGADAVMTSGETSIGKDPINVVKVMDEIVGEAEKHVAERRAVDYDSSHPTVVEALGRGCYTIVNQFVKLNLPGKVIAVSETGYTIRMISKYRPKLQIIALTSNIRTARELNLVWGVRSIYSDSIVGHNLEERAINAVKKACDSNLITKSDYVIMVTSGVQYGGSFIGTYEVSKLIK